jgi:hypothetical protein
LDMLSYWNEHRFMLEWSIYRVKCSRRKNYCICILYLILCNREYLIKTLLAHKCRQK